jgi:hypothetical protein
MSKKGRIKVAIFAAPVIGSFDHKGESMSTGVLH